MSTEHEIHELNKYMHQMLDNQADLRERLARVEQKQEGFDIKLDNFSQNNAREHREMVSLVTDKTDKLDERVKDIEKHDQDQQGELDERKGERRVLSRVFEIVGWLISGGVLMAVGGWLAKKIGIF